MARLAFLDDAGATRYAVDYPALRRRMFADRHDNFLRGDLERLLYEAAVAAGARTAAWFVPEHRWRMAVRDLVVRAGA